MGILNKIDFKEIDLTKETITYKKMEKLTLQDCFKYPNARIFDYTSSKDNPTIYSNVFLNVIRKSFPTCNSLSSRKYIYSIGEFDGAYIQYTKQEDFEDYYVSNCKLRLRHLESLTEEEKQIIQKKYIPEQLGKMMTESSWKALKSLLQYCQKDLLAAFIDYLRGINIDIDNLQKKGVAVYE